MSPHSTGPFNWSYFRLWKRYKLWERIHTHLREHLRQVEGRQRQPTAGILDSQNVKRTECSEERGYDAGKKVNGRKRHVLVDTLGLVLAVLVWPANIITYEEEDPSESAGIRKTREQTGSRQDKNVGLFFTGLLPQGGLSGTFGGTSAELAASFDNLWVAGPDPYPGGCDPTYAFSRAVNVMQSICPEIAKGQPWWEGFGYLPYSGVYDGEIVTNNVSHIKR